MQETSVPVNSSVSYTCSNISKISVAYCHEYRNDSHYYHLVYCDDGGNLTKWLEQGSLVTSISGNQITFNNPTSYTRGIHDVVVWGL